MNVGPVPPKPAPQARQSANVGAQTPDGEETRAQRAKEIAASDRAVTSSSVKASADFHTESGSHHAHEIESFKKAHLLRDRITKALTSIFPSQESEVSLNFFSEKSVVRIIRSAIAASGGGLNMDSPSLIIVDVIKGLLDAESLIEKSTVHAPACVDLEVTG